MDLQLSNKIALVTGSTAGIGNAIATSLAREGAAVIVNGRSAKAVAAAVEAMQAATSGKVSGFAGDLSDAAVAAELLVKHPAVDILVNNLGIFEVRPFEEIRDEDWRRFFDVNVLSGARLSRLDHRPHPEGEAKPRVSKDVQERSFASASAGASFEAALRRLIGRGFTSRADSAELHISLDRLYIFV